MTIFVPTTHLPHFFRIFTTMCDFHPLGITSINQFTKTLIFNEIYYACTQFSFTIIAI